MKLQDKIDEIFSLCCSSNSIGAADFRAICKTFWLCLNNTITFVDLAGVFAISIPPTGVEILTGELFNDFFKAFAKLKFPTENSFVEKLYEEINNAKNIHIPAESLSFPTIIERSVLRTLLKYDLPIKKAYSHFCGQSVRVGGRLNWEEAKMMSIGMELDGFISFAGAYSLIPRYVSAAQCETLYREVLTNYALVGNAVSLNSSILYPQFQMLLVLTAMTKMDELHHGEAMFAKKVNDTGSGHHAVNEALVDLLRHTGITKANLTTGDEYGGGGSLLQRLSPKKSSPNLLSYTFSAATSPEKGQVDRSSPGNAPASAPGDALSYTSGQFFAGTVILPNSEQPTDMYTASGSHSKQAMLLRMEQLFDEIEARMLQSPALSDERERVLAIIASAGESGELHAHSHSADGKVRVSAKPVVIGDALPIPAACPEPVQQLLEAALAHHNLGSFEEALKFLEAASIQLTDIEFRSRDSRKAEPEMRTKTSGGRSGGPNPVAAGGPNPSDEHSIYQDLHMYIVLCKGNVYQSCGDDEQAMLHYMEGLSQAEHRGDKDWESIGVNAIGLLAFYNLRYDVAALCFNAVGEFRLASYGSESAETATSWNNEACCLYCLGRRGDARMRFEKSWQALSSALGHRSARAVTAWKNLEKARRSHAPLQVQSRQDQQDSLRLRPDADMLLLGGSFVIQALPPPQPGGRRKKKGGGGKKKKK